MRVYFFSRQAPVAAFGHCGLLPVFFFVLLCPCSSVILGSRCVVWSVRVCDALAFWIQFGVMCFLITRASGRPLRGMVMSFFCSQCRNKIGAELHICLEEGTNHKRLFKGPSTNDMKK